MKLIIYKISKYFSRKFIFYKKAQIKLLIHSCKGRRKLLKNNNSELLFRIKYDLQRINLINYPINIYGFSNYKINFNDVCTQKLLNLLCGTQFDMKIYNSVYHDFKGFSFPLPIQWINLLKNYGFKFTYYNIFISKILFYFLLFYLFIESFLFFFYKIYKFCILFLQSNKHYLVKEFIYVDSLGDSNIPNLNQSQSLFSWYKDANKNKFINFYHNDNLKNDDCFDKINLKKLPINYFEINNFVDLLKYINWFFLFNFFILINFFKFNFFELIISKDLILSKIMTFKKKEQLPYECLFYKFANRPLWTHIFEYKGSKISLFFYSINTKKNKPIDNNLLDFQWYLSYWNRLYVWDLNEIKLYSSEIKTNPKCIVLPPIIFTKFNYSKPIDDKYIVIFDVQPFRKFYILTTHVSFFYFTYENVKKFINDIVSASLNKDIKIILKRKRFIGNIVDRRYESFINDLAFNKKISIVDYNYDIYKLLNNSIASISLPHTSTPLHARLLNIKSIYYDPSSKLYTNNHLSCGIKVINSKRDLDTWVNTL